MILVTGAAGFIGMHVAEAIMSSGRRVIGIDSLNDYYGVRLKLDRIAYLTRNYPDLFSFHECDFADNDRLQQTLDAYPIGSIIHLGAQAGVRYSIENPHAYVQSNLVGHVNMLEFARGRQLKHLVYASSSSVYGGNDSLPFRVEDRADHPVSLYAATKKADELMSETYAHLYRLPQTGLRFFTVYGPWGRPDMAMWIFTRKILAGEPLPIFNHGKMQRDFTYIDDIVAGVVAAHDSPPSDDGMAKAGGSKAPHRLYNIGNHKPEELLQLVALLEDACGKKAELQLMPMQPGDVVATYADISAIEGDLGFKPSTPLEIGVPRFVSWYRQYTNG